MPVSGSTPRILVVEDEPVINQAVSDRLRGSGYDVVQAWDGPGGVEQFGDSTPDLVRLLHELLPLVTPAPVRAAQGAAARA